MHFQVIKDDFFDKIIAELAISVPEFNSVFDKEDGPYPILGEFGRFLCDNINNTDIVKKGFNFINTFLNNGGSETEEIIVVQIFEQLYEREEIVKIAQTHLIDKSLTLFKKYNIRA